MPLNGPYLRATDKFLRDNGVDPDTCEQVMQLLSGFAEPEAEAAEDVGTVGTRGTFKGFGQDAQKTLFRQIAMDRLLPPELRRWPTPPMSARQKARFDQRFNTERLKVV